jgi:hypothetical protein
VTPPDRGAYGARGGGIPGVDPSERDPVNADDSPTSPDDAAERFATAVEGGVADGAVDPELARDLQIADVLTRHGRAYDPDPETRARARRRLLAALADEGASNGPSRAS